MTNNQREIEADYEDDITEAMYDAAHDGEGTLQARYLRYHLFKRGLQIVPIPESTNAPPQAPST